MEYPTQFNTLPKDLIFDIFSRLPIKTLYQLRCVCKKWLFFLNLNPEFTSFYHQKHKINPLLIFTKQNNETPSTHLSSIYIDGTQIPQFSTNFPHTSSSIISCNGILCFISNHDTFLYDPITKQVSNLPNSTHFGSTFSWAFGYVDQLNGSVFKILHFYTTQKFDNFHYCQMKEIKCEILVKPNSEIGSNSEIKWRYLGKCPFSILGRKDYAFVDGKIYWLIGEKKFNPNGIKIMSFHLGSEDFEVVLFPRSYSNRSVECLDLVEIKDRLCLSDRLPWESIMDIWMMMRSEEGFENLWVRKYRIDLMGIDHHDVRILGCLNKNNGNGSGNGADNDCECECEVEILIKFGTQSFGFYEVENGGFRDLAFGTNMQGWDLNLFLNRRSLL